MDAPIRRPQVPEPPDEPAEPGDRPFIREQVYHYRCPGCRCWERFPLREPEPLARVHHEDRCGVCKRDVRIRAGVPELMPPR